ncbi:MAG TPA: SIMPL domain-containing protein [Allosphingosinicella sp.]|uniref:SIMPL domain-containing protein n=1 Tax=Allosphingosinicella sp. TaxID=2823234 RepID=UPI002EDA2DCB
MASCLVLAGVPAAALAQPAAVAVQPISGTRLDVVATGEVNRVPDLAIISAGVVTRAPTASAAISQNAQQMQRVVAALRRAGVAERDIQTSSINLNPDYRYQENQPPVLTGYQASNQVTVRFRNIAESGEILDALVLEGANQINGPTLTIDKPEEALDEARRGAITTARARAQLYAQAIGKRVGRILSISEAGGYGPRPMEIMVTGARMGVAADAATKIVPGEQTLTVSLSVSFELE